MRRRRIGKALESRITRHAMVPVSDLKANPKNYRLHPDAQRAAVDSSLAELGWVKSVIVNERTGRMIDGHARVEQAEKLGIAEVPVEYVDLSPREEELALAVIDPISSMAETDDAAARILLAGLTDIEGPLVDVLDLIRPVEPEREVEEDDVPPVPATPVTKEGDVWVLGRHVLLCDSCERMKTLLGPKERAALMVTDPPYGVSLEEKYKSRPGGKKQVINRRIANDDKTAAQIEKLWSSWFSAVRPLMADGASFYVTGPHGDLLLPLLTVLRDTGFSFRNVMVWAKDSLVFGRGDYHSQHEPIIFGWVNGAAHHAVANRTETTLWSIPRPKKSEHHPTTKPVELYARAIRNSSDKGQLVIEPFAGSGTGVIACEQLERRCVTTELDPGYCDVVVERWQNLTGEKATRRR